MRSRMAVALAVRSRYTHTNMTGSETNTVGATSIASIFATPTLAALLAVFAREPERRYYQKELVALTGGSLYLVQRELGRLERTGLVVRIPRGRQVEYEFNTGHPAFHGLREALLRTLALGEPIRQALESADGVRLAFVFGSIARGEDQGGSDLDLLVVGELGLREVSTRVVPALRDLGREPNIVVLTVDEFRARSNEGEHFVSTVLGEPKLWVIGDDSQLGELLG
jgi:predicted nucleotidyltransferase